MVNIEIRLIIFFAPKDGEGLYSQQKQDLELTVAQITLIAKFRLRLKKIGKTTRPFRYDVNQILHDFIVEVTRLDLVDRVPEEPLMEVHNTVQKAVMKTIPRKKKCRKAKRLFDETLQITEERRK